MEPEFKEGEIVIVNPHVEPKSGDYVVVKNDEEEATFKQLKKYWDTIVLHPLNSKYEDIELEKGINTVLSEDREEEGLLMQLSSFSVISLRSKRIPQLGQKNSSHRSRIIPHFF